MKYPTPQKKYYVYTASYPGCFIDDDGTDLSNIVFYVGKGTTRPKGYQQRMHDHELEAANGGSGVKCDAIRKIWKKVRQVQWEIVFETFWDYEALAIEKEHIRSYAGPYLTNLTHNFVLSSNILRYAEEQEDLKDEQLRKDYGVKWFLEMTRKVARTSRPSQQEVAKAPKSRKERKFTPEHMAHIAERRSKTWTGFVSPNGEVYRQITNLRQFALKHELDPSNLYQVAKGTLRQTKGWRSLQLLAEGQYNGG